MSNPLRISAVSYLNTKPFIYGLHQSRLSGQMTLSLDIPSECARKLRDGEADIALAPVAVIADMRQAHLASSYCIGATGAVKTVCVFSERPIEQVKRLYLDFHSRTSVQMVQLLCRHYWRAQPEFVAAQAGFEREIGGDTAALIIGDRAIGLEKKYAYVYDLGEIWRLWTGLPFVFAAWISARPMPQDTLRALDEAFKTGIDAIPQLIQILPQIPGFDLEDYYRRCISYELDAAKRQGMRFFLDQICGPDGYRLIETGEQTPRVDQIAI